jgi:hypothetical protein
MIHRQRSRSHNRGAFREQNLTPGDRTGATDILKPDGASMTDGADAGFGESPTPKFITPDTAPKMTRKQVFDHLLAGGSREGLPEEFVADYARSRRHWSV